MSTILREVAVALGLEVDAASFAEGELAAKALEIGLEAVVEIGNKAIEFFVDIVKETVIATDEIDKNAQAVGLTTDAYQELVYVGKLAGVGAEEMSQSFGILSRNLYAASKGGEEQAKVFQQLGVHVKGADGKVRSIDDVLADVADKFQKMPDGAQKTALSMEAFGRAGKRMIPLLNEGSAGLAEMREEARDLGTVIDEETVKQGTAIKDNVERLTALWEGIKLQAGASIFPVLKQLTDGAIAWVKANKEIIKQKIEVVLKGIAKAVHVLLDAFDVLWGSAKLLYDVISTVVKGALAPLLAALDAIGPVARAAAVAFAIGWAIAAAPVVAIAAAIGGVLLLLNSIQRWREGKDSLFGDWMKQLDDWRKPGANDVWWVKGLKDTVDLLHEAVELARQWDVLTGKEVPAQSNPNVLTPASPPWKVARVHQIETANAAPNIPKFLSSTAPASGFQMPDFTSSPSLPPGGGVLRGPIHQDNRRTYQIYQAPGMSPQDVVNLIQQHEDAANEEAAAALGD